MSGEALTGELAPPQASGPISGQLSLADIGLDDSPEARRACRRTFGSDDRGFAERLLSQVVNVAQPSTLGDPVGWVNCCVAAMHDSAPRDPLEAMLIAQMISVHTAMTEFGRRSLMEGQPADIATANARRASMLGTTYARQMEALKRYRR